MNPTKCYQHPDNQPRHTPPASTSYFPPLPPHPDRKPHRLRNNLNPTAESPRIPNNTSITTVVCVVFSLVIFGVCTLVHRSRGWGLRTVVEASFSTVATLLTAARATWVGRELRECLSYVAVSARLPGVWIRIGGLPRCRRECSWGPSGPPPPAGGPTSSPQHYLCSCCSPDAELGVRARIR